MNKDIQNDVVNITLYIDTFHSIWLIERLLMRQDVKSSYIQYIKLIIENINCLQRGMQRSRLCHVRLS